MADDDVVFVRRVLAGHVNDYRVLVQRHQGPIYRFVTSLVGHRHEAEDITQEVFLAAFENLASFDCRRARFSTWLFTMARNRAVNHLKRCRNTTMVDATPEPIDTDAPEFAAEESEFLDQLDQALASLPVDQKTAFVLSEIEEYSYAAIAQIEHTSLGTVKSRVHRAKRRLRAALQAFVRGS